MNGWVWIIAVVAVIASLPFWRYLIKRLSCCIKIKKFCKKNGYILYKTHTLWFLGGKGNRRCDFYIEMPENIYAVKLFGVMRKKYKLVLTDSGKYYMRDAFAMFLPYRVFLLPFDRRKRPLPDYDFRYKHDSFGDAKPHTNVLLVNPVSHEIRSSTSTGSEQILLPGDEYNGMKVYSLSTFMQDLG